ncbi:alpha/beta fold hydrolase [Roseateles sp. DB2]|uniref:alpha/beta fold hydrolase n=1 Tax=Roseateles sp. DB2 TaxID=3453717 RepID=UPI003EE9CB43
MQRHVNANGLRIAVDDQGPRGAPALLMIMGLGMQLVAWPQGLVDALTARDLRVIRFDNRDIGLSQHLDHLGLPHVGWASFKHLLHLPVRSPYSLADMARDAQGVMDALDLPRVHVWGASMGGMIAQHLVDQAPDRVQSLTLMMTTAGARHLPGPTWPVRQALLARPPRRDEATLQAHFAALYRLIGSPAYPPAPGWLEARVAEALRRSDHPQGMLRQLMAVVADEDRTPRVTRIQAPSLVIHGEADPLVPIAAGRHLARHLRHVETDFIPGMGHDLPEALWPRYADRVAALVHGAGAA